MQVLLKHMSGHHRYACGAHRGQKKVSDPQKLELQICVGRLVGAENWT